MGILGKMGRHPVQDHADIVLMTVIYEILEIVRRAEAARRRVIPRALVPPGTLKWVFGHRQELHVRVAHLLHILHQLVGQLPVSKYSIVFGVSSPTAQMNFVDIQGLVQRLPAGAILHPLAVCPRIAVHGPDPGSGPGRILRKKAIRVRLVDPEINQRQLNGVLVACRRLIRSRDEELPDPFPVGRHRVGMRVPTVEGPNHTYALSIWCPDRELHTVNTPDRAKVGAKLAVAIEIVSLTKQVGLVIRKPRSDQ